MTFVGCPVLSLVVFAFCIEFSDLALLSVCLVFCLDLSWLVWSRLVFVGRMIRPSAEEYCGDHDRSFETISSRIPSQQGKTGYFKVGFVVSRLLSSCLALSGLRLVWSYLVWSGLVFSCLVSVFVVWSGLVLSCLVVSCLVSVFALS
jgi:hypothetical protein